MKLASIYGEQYKRDDKQNTLLVISLVYACNALFLSCSNQSKRQVAAAAEFSLDFSFGLSEDK